MRAANPHFLDPHSNPSAPIGLLRSINHTGLFLAHRGTGLKKLTFGKSQQICRSQGRWLPVSVQLCSDVVMAEDPLVLSEGLKSLQGSGVESIAVCIWWGIVERTKPREYDWSAYHALFSLIMDMGLNIQAFLCFHGDRKVPLPAWVLEEGEKDPDIFYTDKQGKRNRTYLSLGVDNVPILKGRTPLTAYEDFMSAFVKEFKGMMGTRISEVVVGLGSDGELKYPAHPGDGRWSFAGIGEFQCYDRYMHSTLKACAERCGHREWGIAGGPNDVGGYNSKPHQTRFFKPDGDWQKPYGEFFLQWYAASLIRHGHAVLARAKNVFSMHQISLSARLPLVHWWYDQQHAAELTAGIYNTEMRNGYVPILSMLADLGISLHLPGGEVRNADQPSYANCNPEMLIAHVRACAAGFEIPITIGNVMSEKGSLSSRQIQVIVCHESYYESIRLPQVSSILLTSMCDGSLRKGFWDQVQHCLPDLNESCPTSFHDVERPVLSKGFSHEMIHQCDSFTCGG